MYTHTFTIIQSSFKSSSQISVTKINKLHILQRRLLYCYLKIWLAILKTQENQLEIVIITKRVL